jgi:hypothetical protein
MEKILFCDRVSHDASMACPVLKNAFGIASCQRASPRSRRLAAVAFLLSIYHVVETSNNGA